MTTGTVRKNKAADEIATIEGGAPAGEARKGGAVLERRPAEPLTWKPEEIARDVGCGRTTIYAAMKVGALKARKIGSRTVILDEDKHAWLRALPARVPSPKAA